MLATQMSNSLFPVRIPENVKSLSIHNFSCTLFAVDPQKFSNKNHLAEVFAEFGHVQMLPHTPSAREK